MSFQLTMVKDLHEGDVLDLEGDEYADPHHGSVLLENVYVTVERVVVETPECILVDCTDYACGFPPDHKVKVIAQ